MEVQECIIALLLTALVIAGVVIAKKNLIIGTLNENIEFMEYSHAVEIALLNKRLNSK
jgi:hypothetical protein